MRKEKHSSDPQKENIEDIYLKKFRKIQKNFEVLKKKYELEKKENLDIYHYKKDRDINTKSSQTKGQESEIVEKGESIEEGLARIRKETEDLRKGLAALAGFRQHGKTPDEDYSKESIYTCRCGKKFASPELFIDHVCEEEE